jgi:hypothetical protein
MKGHGEKFSYRREHAIAALLSCQTIGEAANACGVAPVTLWRWLQDPSFDAQYRAARKQVVERAVSELQLATCEAVMTLRRNLRCENPTVQVRAAQIILDLALKRENEPLEESRVEDADTKRALEESIRNAALEDHIDESEAAWQLFERLSDNPNLRRLELWPASVAERLRLQSGDLIENVADRDNPKGENSLLRKWRLSADHSPL